MKPQEVHIGHYNNVVTLYHEESDRAAAILAGSFVEHYLAALLKAHLIEDSETDSLFDGYGPLSSFAQRIAMAGAMGLINARARRELKAIKEIRNHFAHHPVSATFTDEVLEKPFNKLSVTFDPNFNAEGEGPLSNRKLIYLLSISMIVVEINNKILAKCKATCGVNNALDSLSHSPNMTVKLSGIEPSLDSVPKTLAELTDPSPP